MNIVVLETTAILTALNPVLRIWSLSPIHKTRESFTPWWLLVDYNRYMHYSYISTCILGNTVTLPHIFTTEFRWIQLEYMYVLMIFVHFW